MLGVMQFINEAITVKNIKDLSLVLGKGKLSGNTIVMSSAKDVDTLTGKLDKWGYKKSNEQKSGNEIFLTYSKGKSEVLITANDSDMKYVVQVD